MVFKKNDIPNGILTHIGNAKNAHSIGYLKNTTNTEPLYLFVDRRDGIQYTVGNIENGDIYLRQNTPIACTQTDITNGQKFFRDFFSQNRMLSGVIEIN